jgi:hypothetical protein
MNGERMEAEGQLFPWSRLKVSGKGGDSTHERCSALGNWPVERGGPMRSCQGGSELLTLRKSQRRGQGPSFCDNCDSLFLHVHRNYGQDGGKTGHPLNVWANIISLTS